MKIRLTPIIVSVLTLASAVLYFVFPTHIPLNWELPKQQEFFLAGIALGLVASGMIVFLVANRRSFVRFPGWQAAIAHLFALFVQVFVFVPNLTKLLRAFKYDFVPVMPSNALGVWMLVLSGLLVCGAIFHPRKVLSSEV